MTTPAPLPVPVPARRPDRTLGETISRALYDAAGLAANERTPAQIIGTTTYQSAQGGLTPGETRTLRIDVSGSSSLVILSINGYGDQAAGFLYTIKSSVDNTPINAGAGLHSRATFDRANNGQGWMLPRPLMLPFTAYLMVDVVNLSTSLQHVWLHCSGYRVIR